MEKYGLVIGNNTYTHFKKLKNAINDATLISNILRLKGFEVKLLTDLDFLNFQDEIKNFKLQVENKNAMVLVYYAGHGFQIDDKNYLLPIDAEKSDQSYILERKAIFLQDITDNLMTVNGPVVIVLDACRDGDDITINSSLNNKGLHAVEAGKNMLIAFSTQPGKTAKDRIFKRDNNGPYANILADNLKKYGLEISELFRQTRESMLKKHGFDQIPWEHSSLVKRYTMDEFNFIGSKYQEFEKRAEYQVTSEKEIDGDCFTEAKKETILDRHSCSDTIATNEDGSIIFFACGPNLFIFCDQDFQEYPVVQHFGEASNNEIECAIFIDENTVLFSTSKKVMLGKIQKENDDFKVKFLPIYSCSDNTNLYVCDFKKLDDFYHIVIGGGSREIIVLKISLELDMSEVIYTSAKKYDTYSIAFSSEGNVFFAAVGSSDATLIQVDYIKNKIVNIQKYERVDKIFVIGRKLIYSTTHHPDYSSYEGKIKGVFGHAKLHVLEILHNKLLDDKKRITIDLGSLNHPHHILDQFDPSIDMSKRVSAIVGYQNRYIIVATDDPSLILIDLELNEIIDEKLMRL